MTLTEANVANLRAKKLTAKPELSVPRKLLILRPGEGKAKAPPMPDVTDDFYDVHEDDLRAISLGAAAGGQPNAPVMQTAAMRELTKLQALKEYSHARIRVRLPGGLLVEASYHPQEPVSHVLELVNSCLIEPLSSLHGGYLFTTPPRTELTPSHSLVEAGLVPAATAVLAWKPTLAASFADAPPEELLKEHARELLAAAASAGQEDEEWVFPTAVNGAATSSSSDAASASSSAAAGKRAVGASSSGGEEGGEEKKKGKPKWMKM